MKRNSKLIIDKSVDIPIYHNIKNSTWLLLYDFNYFKVHNIYSEIKHPISIVISDRIKLSILNSIREG